MAEAEKLTLSRCLPSDPQVRDFIHQQIKAYNNARSPAHLAIRSDGSRSLDFVLRGPAGELCGGLIAEAYWGWLEIVDLWVQESQRGRGYGTALLESAESAATAEGCARALLRTFSFQARGFYEKCGYRVVGELKDYPPGQSFYWMVKSLKQA